MSPVGPAKQAANQLFPGPQGVCLPESRPVQTQAANNQMQEEGDFKEMSTVKTKTNKHRNHDSAGIAPGKVEDDEFAFGDQGRPHWGDGRWHLS